MDLQEYWNNRPADKTPARWGWIEEIVEIIKPEKTIEVGSGGGVWANCFKNYVGYDFALNREGAYENQKFGDIVAGIDDQADLVFINMVLLHIDNKDIKKAIKNLLKMSKNIILIEPVTYRLQRKAAHCFYHNYLKLIPDLFLWRVIPSNEEDIGIFVRLQNGKNV